MLKRESAWERFWRDFNSENHWRFPDLDPLKQQELIGCPIIDQAERIRAAWFWRRRPRLLLGEGVLGYCLVIGIGMVLPLVPQIGFLLDVIWLVISSLLIASDTVRGVRWRRDYEASLERLVRSARRKKKI